MSFVFDAYQGIFFNFFHSVFYLSSNFLLRQILPNETPMQDREPDSPLNDPVDVEGGLVVVNTQSVDSLVRQTTDGEGVICSTYLSIVNMNQKSSDVCRCRC